MLTLDKVFDAQQVLKNIVRETNVVRAYGIADECELYLKPENPEKRRLQISIIIERNQSYE